MKRIVGADLQFGLERQQSDHFRRAGYFSPTLGSDREAILDFRKEALLYRDRMGSLRSREASEIIRKLSSGIRPGACARVFIAIAAHCSERGVGRALLSYASAEAGLDDVEVVILVNGADSFAHGCRQIEAQIALARKKLPGLRIHLLKARFDNEQAIGLIKGILADSIVQAAERAGIADPLIIFNDADQLAASPGYLREIRDAFLRNGRLDLISGPVYYGYLPGGKGPMPLDCLAPELFLGGNCLVAIQNAFLPEFLTFGNNFALRLSAYCAAGGFDFGARIREDFRLGFNVKALRRNPREQPRLNPRHQRFLPGASVVTDPRRMLAGILKGKAVWRSWKSFNAVYGGKLHIEALLARYQRKANLLQARDIREASQSPLAMEKLRRRVRAIFLQNLRGYAPSLLHRSKFGALCQAFGLELEEVTYDRSGFYRSGRIDWEKSGILAVLREWVT